MKIYDYGEKLAKDKYYEIQVERSRRKFKYCRVSTLDTIFTINLLKNYGLTSGPIICMGTRNGREVDLFRIALSSNKLWKKLSYLFENNKHCFSSYFPYVESFHRSDIKDIQKNSVIGVEINPSAKRKDILIGSFDELPAEYENKFELVYSNSFDQGIDPQKTANEWCRVTKNGGFIVFQYKENTEATYTDPTGSITIKDIENLFKGNIVFNQKSNFDSLNPSAVIIRIKK